MERTMGPIERDEGMDRTYIPLPGGWEVQTKGNGSTFRICGPDGVCLPIPDAPYLHYTLEIMAYQIHKATESAILEAAQKERERITGG